MAATMKLPLQLMTGNGGLSAEDGIGNLLSTGCWLSEVLGQPPLDRKGAMDLGQITERDDILPTSIAALRGGGDEIPLGRCMLEDGLYQAGKTLAFQG